jgi:BirA family biotin operon repressor/biotin-[acetyl-CoA-carboxylase] ligase
VLKSAGLRTPQLKWPNDLYAEDKKLGGILIEVSGEATAGAMAVIGVGINIDHQSLDQASIDQPITSLREQQVAESRNVLVARLISAVIRMAKDFEQTGLKGFVDRWPEFDAFKNRRVALTGPGIVHYGICRGIAEDGGLRLETDSGEQVFYGGELSLRLG